MAAKVGLGYMYEEIGTPVRASQALDDLSPSPRLRAMREGLDDGNGLLHSLDVGTK